MQNRDPDDVFASILVDVARSVEIAPRMLPERFGAGGRYLLEELIGIGRDAHVYRAVDLHLSKPTAPARVAIKIRSSGASTRMEALVGRSVEHENVIRIIDHGELDDGTAYVVQEWADGGDLTDLPLPLPARRAARLVAEIARGVQALHSAGNVHGDLKPSNILRTRDGAPKVTDFDQASATDLGEYAQGGNLALMAPERILDPTVLPSPLSDIYALGGLLYLFLTGEPPHGERAGDIIAHHKSGAPVAPAGFERDLARICSRALARDPGKRYQSAEALATDLEHWLACRPIYWTRPSTIRRMVLLARRRPWAPALGALAIVAVVGLAGWIEGAKNREMSARERAVALTEKQMEEDRAKVRTIIRDFISSGFLQRDAQNGASVFAALVWLDWFARLGLLDGATPVVAREQQVKALNGLRQHYRETGQVGTLPDALAAFSLAYVHLLQGEYETAEPYIADAEAGVLGTLAEHDDVRRSLAALREVAEFERAASTGSADAEALRSALAARRKELMEIDGTHDVAYLIKLVFQRHDPPPIAE